MGTYTDTTVVPGQTYVYDVDARNSAGASSPTPPLSIAIPAPRTGVAFALLENSKNPAAAAAALPSHVACSWVYHWNALQPSLASAIDWSLIDAALAAGAAAGKPNSMRVNCGVTSPSGIPTVPITYTNASGQTQTQQMPRYWDPSYTTPLRQFLTAYGARYGDDPRILIVQMPGCGRIGELAMGTPSPGTPTWQSYGYTDAALIAAWELVIDTYLSVFPTGYLAWDMSSEPFNGAHALDALIAFLATLPPRVLVQGNGLKNMAGFAKAVTQSVGQRPVGYQAFLPVSQGGATVPQVLDTLATVPANYTELYAADCTAAVDPAIAAWAATAPGL